MKITLISLDVLGINNEIYNSLKQLGHDAHHINFYEFRYRYPTVLHRVFNFLGKIFFNYNIKKQHLNKEILLRLEKLGKQDKILMLNANFLLPHIIKNIKPYANEMVAFFNDGSARIPKILDVAPLFDRVYTFEPNDAKTHNFKFATNYIFKESEKTNKPHKFEVFNISTFSNRTQLIDNIALELDRLNISYNIISFGKKRIKSTSKVNYVSKRINMEDVNALVAECNVLLDIHRKGQDGLSFRVFESLGNKKKLITTNADIRHYDFYNPENILILDKDNINIPVSFFEKHYTDIPEHIYKKYVVGNWVKTILNI